MAAQFQFIMRSGPSVGKTFQVEGNEIIIGRDMVNQIPINDAEVSRKHAKLIWQGQGYTLEDLGSTNGTFVNGKRLTMPYPLRPGELVSLGENISLMFEAVVDPNATMISASSRAADLQIPRQQAAPQTPPPPPVYSGQVPVSPEPYAEPPAKKRLSPWIIIVVVILALICLCGLFFLIVDQLRLWCTLFPFFFPGAC